MSYLNKYIPMNFYEVNATKLKAETPEYIKRLRDAYKKERSRKVMVFDPVSKQLIKIPINNQLNNEYKKAEVLINNIKNKIDNIKNKKKAQKAKAKPKPKQKPKATPKKNITKPKASKPIKITRSIKVNT